MVRLINDPIGSAYGGGASPIDVASLSEAHRLVIETLDSLPHEQREAFRLKFQDNLSYREIAQVLGASLGKVSKLVADALCAIRDRLARGRGLIGEGEQ